MKTIKNKAFFAAASVFAPIAIFGIFGMAASAYASVPTLTLTAQNQGQTLISVSGDANSAVSLYYSTQANNSTVATTGSLGTTNSYGYFSTTLNNSTYNIPYQSLVYVNVDGQNSTSVQWPNYSSTSGNGGLSLNENYATVQINQTVSVSVTNYNYGVIYIQSNSNPQNVSAVVNGNQINLIGENYGSATINVCQGSLTVCGTIYVTVSNQAATNNPYPITTNPYPYSYQNSYPAYYISPAPSISLSANNVSFAAGTSQSIQIYGSGYYFISQDTNQNVVSANLNGTDGNMLTLYGIAPGSSNIMICENSGTTSCATITANVYANQPIAYPYQQYPYPVSYTWYRPYVQPAPVIYPVQNFLSYIPWRW